MKGIIISQLLFLIKPNWSTLLALFLLTNFPIDTHIYYYFALRCVNVIGGYQKFFLWLSLNLLGFFVLHNMDLSQKNNSV